MKTRFNGTTPMTPPAVMTLTDVRAWLHSAGKPHVELPKDYTTFVDVETSTGRFRVRKSVSGFMVKPFKAAKPLTVRPTFEYDDTVSTYYY